MIHRKDRARAHPTRTLASIVLAPALALSLAAPVAAQEGVNIASMSQGTLSYATGTALAKVLSEHINVRTNVVPTSGDSVLLPLVHGGEAELGIANVLEVVNAYNGAERGRKQDKLRVLSVMYPLKVGFFVKKDSDIKSIADLKGKRVTHGYTALGSISVIVDGLLANGGLSRDDVRQVTVPNVIRGADDFAAGRADAFFFGIGAGKVAEVDAAVGGVRLLPLDTSPEAISNMQKVFPFGYEFTQQPGSGFTGVDQPTTLMAYDNLLVVGASVPEEKAYQVARTVATQLNDLRQLTWQFVDTTAASLYKEFPVPYHPGAVRYFEESGLSPQRAAAR